MNAEAKLQKAIQINSIVQYVQTECRNSAANLFFQERQIFLRHVRGYLKQRIDFMTNSEFRSIYRCDRTAFELVCNELHPYLEPARSAVGIEAKRMLTVKHKVALSLCYMGGGKHGAAMAKCYL